MALAEVQQAAVSLFAQRGYAATGIRELGKAAGLNSASLYHYTGAKEELLASIMRVCLQELLRAGRLAVGSTSAPDVQLACLVSTHVGLSALNPRTARVTDQEVRALAPNRHAELMELRDAYDSLFAEVLERGARAGLFRLTDLKVARLALLEMCNGVANWYQPDGELTVGQIQERFVEFTGRLVGVEGLLSRIDIHDFPPLQLSTEPRSGSDTTSTETA